MRMTTESVWKMIAYVMNAVVFILIGLNIPGLFTRLSVYAPLDLLWYAVAVCSMCVLVRFIYVYMSAYGTRFIFSCIRKVDPYPAWQNVWVIGYVGMRGVVSLATALALPVQLSWGVDFPDRDLILFLTTALIVFTLVGQGLTLPWIVRKLTLNFDPKLLYEDWNARMSATREALRKIEEIEASGTAHAPALARIRSHYQERLESLGDGPNTPLVATEELTSSSHPVIQAENNIWQEVLTIERGVVLNLRKSFAIGDDVMHDIMRELDLMANRFERSE
jgi:monovalent cation/hydrogen antiporter